MEGDHGGRARDEGGDRHRREADRDADHQGEGEGEGQRRVGDHQGPGPPRPGEEVHHRGGRGEHEAEHGGRAFEPQHPDPAEPDRAEHEPGERAGEHEHRAGRRAPEGEEQGDGLPVDLRGRRGAAGDERGEEDARHELASERRERRDGEGPEDEAELAAGEEGGSDDRVDGVVELVGQPAAEPGAGEVEVDRAPVGPPVAAVPGWPDARDPEGEGQPGGRGDRPGGRGGPGADRELGQGDGDGHEQGPLDDLDQPDRRKAALGLEDRGRDHLGGEERRADDEQEGGGPDHRVERDDPDRHRGEDGGRDQAAHLAPARGPGQPPSLARADQGRAVAEVADGGDEGHHRERPAEVGELRRVEEVGEDEDPERRQAGDHRLSGAEGERRGQEGATGEAGPRGGRRRSGGHARPGS